MDVLEEKWDPAGKTLSGTSRVIGGDPYELRVALPGEGNWRAVEFTAGDATIRPGAKSPHGVCAIIETKEDREVKWQVRFDGESGNRRREI